MPPTPPRNHKIEEALAARDALASALSRAGIQLPAMDIRTPWTDEREEEPTYALVHLGVCAAPVAHELAEVITKGADASRVPPKTRAELLSSLVAEANAWSRKRI